MAQTIVEPRQQKDDKGHHDEVDQGVSVSYTPEEINHLKTL